MSIIITVNSIEQNVGVSSTVLTLSERLNFFTKKSTCIVELDYENPSFSYSLEKGPIGAKNIDNILPFLKDKTIVDDSLIEVVKFNAQSFKNSNIDIIYGSKKRLNFNNEELNILIETLRQNYENIIIDYGNKIVPDILMDNSDMNILITQASNRFIESLSKNRRDYISKKTHLLVNNSSKGTTEIAFMLRDKFKNTEVLGQLPASNTLNDNLLNGIINVERGEYGKKLNKVALNICKILSIEVKVKNSLTEKLLSKQKERGVDIFIEGYEKIPLSEILIQKNICTREEIEMCLKLQNKRLG